ncbi:MAG: hypothetical protein CMJ64_00270 [Planctomycetaceae bacterium]|nr:hypothetical protein [Planctomycetaceae bacterium]
MRTISFIVLFAFAAERAANADERLFGTYCFDCHGHEQTEAGINLERLTEDLDVAKDFRPWRKIADKLEQGEMPPEDAPQPSEADRQRLASAARQKLHQSALQHADDPGPVTIRRLTGAEYAYTIRDLTGLELDLERDFVGDAVGGEGFANVGDVQFMQDSTLERYLDAAKRVAGHAVIGAGPMSFFEDPGQTGFELSAITRIQQIYRDHGFRSAAGEGGEAFGLDLYPRAFFTAWRFRHRDQLGLGSHTIANLAQEEDIDVRFASYIWSVLNQANPSFPISDIVAKWQALPVPSQPLTELELDGVRKRCEQLHQTMHDWQTRFGQNADAKEEAPVLAEDSFDVAQSKPLEMNVNWPKGTKVAHLLVSIESANRDGRPNAVVIWQKPAILWRIPDRRLKDPVPLRTVISEADIRRLDFGNHPGNVPIGIDDFVTTGTEPLAFELPIAEGASSARLTVTAELDVAHGDDCIVRCTISQEEETDQGKQISALLAKPESVAFGDWKAGVLDFARVLPQVSHREPAPSDRDPIPFPFDNSYNNPERNDYHYKIKYHRDDRFLVDNILDDATRQRLDEAWADLSGSFEYHDAFLAFVATKYDIEMNGKGIAELDPSWITRQPPEPRRLIEPLRQSYAAIQRAFRSAQPNHLDNVSRLASRAWRRPLTKDEQRQLRAYYDQLRADQGLSHRKAIKTLLARVLVAPEFLYRAEGSLAAAASAGQVGAVPLSDWELASRLSYFLWSSLPDEELRRAAAAGELSDPRQLTTQTRRMLRDPKIKRFAAEFFGQWFGFYQFDRYRGIDLQRFPEFTDSLKNGMHKEAVLFFEHIVRNDRPPNEILFADYVFANAELAEHYGLRSESLGATHELVPQVGSHHRGGLLGLGAVLAVTSAPRRTSPVKRGDWVLRRVLGTPVPPPPADAGSIPADDVQADGLTVRKRLEAHSLDASCNNCHSRIDPLGFSLEQYDAIGRWRERYRDGQPIESSAKLRSGVNISGLKGLRAYLNEQQHLFRRTLCTKLVGYALGRGESISDVLLIEQMMTEAENAGSFSALVERVVSSRQFRYRRSISETPPPPSKNAE